MLAKIIAPMGTISLDADQAALLVRATARVSAVILAADLLVAARRIRFSGGGPAEAGPHRKLDYRSLDVWLFGAFIVSHTIHFICVGLLTIATAGANIDVRSGYTGVVVVGILFYVACAAVMRVKLRPSLEWTAPRQRRTEIWFLMPIWIAFFQAYISRPLQSWLFAALAAGLLYSVARFVIAALRSKVSPTPVRVS
jgi:hypothetical protein